MNLPPALTPVLIEIATLGIFFAMLLIYRHTKQRFNHRRLPFQGDALRAPGEALRVKYEDLKVDFGMYMAMVIVMPLLVYANYIQAKVIEASVSAMPSVILMLTAVAFFIWRSVQQLRRITRLRIGYAGEVAVGEQLNQLMLQGYRMFHDVPGDKAFNVDHVVVGPAGVFAVETKTRTKKESRDGKADYKVTFDGKKLSFDCDKGRYNTKFLEQTRRNAEWLSALLTKSTAEKIPVKGVLVLPGWFVNRTGRADVLVMNHREVRTLPKAGTTEPLRPDQVQRIVYQLEQRCRNVELTPKVMQKEKEAFS